MSYSEEHSPILTIKTSKNWVLPPRPKNPRRARVSTDKKKPKACSSQTVGNHREATTSQPIKSHASSLHTSPSVASLPLELHATSCAAVAVSKPGAHAKLSTASPPKIPAYQEKPLPGPTSSSLRSVNELNAQIKHVDHENYTLKTKLLLLIHQYRCLKTQVDSASSPSLHTGFYDTATTARKRVFNEMGDETMSDLITDLNHLSHASTLSPLEQETDPEQFEAELFNFVNLDINTLLPVVTQAAEDSAKCLDSVGVKDFEGSKLRSSKAMNEFISLKLPNQKAVSQAMPQEKKPLDGTDEDLDDDLVFLSRLASPLMSEADENLLMTSLTRSTTVSTTNSSMDKKSYTKLFDLPAFSEDGDGFLFENATRNEKVMSVIEEDHYNQVADFLEEKLMSNDISYYMH